MRQLILLCLAVGLYFSPNTATAQQNLKTRVNTVTAKDGIVRFAIEGSSPFYAGNNAYILYIGSSSYRLNEQTTNDKGGGLLTFLIPIKNYSDAKDGDAMYLSYGELERTDTENMSSYLQQHTSTCWDLGKFTKDLLK